MTGTGHIESWVFDLDNTLYAPSAALFVQVEARMGGFIAGRFGIGRDEARAMQKRFFREYGTTLRGLMTEHRVPPDEFLDYVHDLDLSVLDPDRRLDAALARLPGRKVIYTNATVAHAERVMDRLGIARHFDGIFDIVAADYQPKPAAAGYDAMLARHGIDPARSAMLEDIARNLVPAHALGMTTVWVRQRGHGDRDVAELGDLSHIHHTIDDLAGWLEGVTTPAL